MAFYGSDAQLRLPVRRSRLRRHDGAAPERLKAGDLAGMRRVVTDEMLDQYAVVCRWDEVVDRLLARYGGMATA